MKATVYLTLEGAQALKAHTVGFFGSDEVLDGHQSLLNAKHAAQQKPVSEYMTAETTLPEWEGGLKERAAVGLGLRKKSARFIERVEIVA